MELVLVTASSFTVCIDFSILYQHSNQTITVAGHAAQEDTKNPKEEDGKDECKSCILLDTNPFLPALVILTSDGKMIQDDVSF